MIYRPGSILLGFAALVASASDMQGVAAAWEDPAVNGVNRREAHAWLPPLASEDAALSAAIEPDTPYVQSLNGTWRFFWTGTPDGAPQGFERTDFDDARWFDIDVPSCVELKGWGVPIYTNAKLPFTNNPPFINREYNPVSNYRRTFTVPESWKGRRIVLRFEGVASAMEVWVNGRSVGYSEDSRLPAEFDITPYLNFSNPSNLSHLSHFSHFSNLSNLSNLLCVRVYRWCDGSYLENQDMFRLSGIFRDVLLYAEPTDGIGDVVVKTSPVKGSDQWRLDVEVKNVGRASPPCAAVTASLFDADRKKVCDLQPSTFNLQPSTFSHTFAAHTWSAEDPYLYTLVVKSNNQTIQQSNNSSADIRRVRVGFRHFEIRGNEIFLNGAKLRFRGVNRHETHPTRGYSVTREDMLNDVLLMKRHNIDSVRTSHYPFHRYWYDLCDRYGLYVMAEANVESGFNNPAVTNTVAFFPEWTQAIRERNVRNVLNFRNHPSVLVWSLGNESGAGPDFVPVVEELRKLDPTRPLHYVDLPSVSDFACGMYVDVDKWMRTLRGKLKKPYVLTEYAHAMGNGLGNFKDYWDVIYENPGFCGGFVWDWADQAVEKGVGRDRHLAYGGDFDEEVNDGPFCVNGIVTAYRQETAKLREVAHCHRQLVVSGDWPNLMLENRFAFTGTEAFAGRWTLLSNGVAVATSDFALPSVKPGSKAPLAVTLPSLPTTGELFLNLEFSAGRAPLSCGNGRESLVIPVGRASSPCGNGRESLSARAGTPWPQGEANAPWPRGHVIARDQVAVRDRGRGSLPRQNEEATSLKMRPAAAAAVRVRETARDVTVEAGTTRLVFARETGTLAELTLDGRPVLREGPRLTVMRALTDNDVWLRNVYWSSKNRDFLYENGMSQLRYHARPFEVSRAADGSARIVSHVRVTSTKSGGFEHTMTWTVRGDGTVRLENETEPFGHLPKLPRLGLTWTVAPELENFAWYGRGPGENYVDRNASTFVGRYASTVTEQYVDYVRPQDCGAKTDVRWLELTAADGRGLRFAAAEPFVAQALHYTWEDLEFARHRRQQQRIRSRLVPRPETYLNTDLRQLGLGGASCGTEPLAAYRFENKPERWAIELAPVMPTRGASETVGTGKTFAARPRAADSDI